MLKYPNIPIRECNEPLVMLDSGEFVLQPIYYEKGFSDTSIIQIRLGVLERLKQAQINLQTIRKGYRIKIWDGFRSLKTQKNIYDDFYAHLKAEHPDWTDDVLRATIVDFVSLPTDKPTCPPPHNTGGAIDLTVVDENGIDLPMGTGFDDFTEQSHTNYFANDKLAKTYHENRMLLKQILEGVGLSNDPLEWWHFSYGDQEWAERTNADQAIYSSAESLFNTAQQRI